MFFLAAILVGWIGGDFVYRKVAAKNIFLHAAQLLFYVDKMALTYFLIGKNQQVTEASSNEAD